MLNRSGVTAVAFSVAAAGLGFAAYFAEKWLTNGNLYLNIERGCDEVNGAITCADFSEDEELKINKYLQIAGGPGFALLAALYTLIKLCCGANCCVYFGAINAFLSCAAYVASLILFSIEHYWTDSERDTYTISWGIIMASVAAILALIAAILMIASGIQTRNRFGGKVVDAMQMKRSEPRTVQRTSVNSRVAPRGGRRV